MSQECVRLPWRDTELLRKCYAESASGASASKSSTSTILRTPIPPDPRVSWSRAVPSSIRSVEVRCLRPPRRMLTRRGREHSRMPELLARLLAQVETGIVPRRRIQRLNSGYPWVLGRVNLLSGCPHGPGTLFSNHSGKNDAGRLRPSAASLCCVRREGYSIELLRQPSSKHPRELVMEREGNEAHCPGSARSPRTRDARSCGATDHGYLRAPERSRRCDRHGTDMAADERHVGGRVEPCARHDPNVLWVRDSADRLRVGVRRGGEHQAVLDVPVRERGSDGDGGTRPTTSSARSRSRADGRQASCRSVGN